MRFFFQVIGTLGGMIATSGVNLITGSDPKKVALGYWLLIPGAVFGTGGLAAITYLFIKEYRAKLTATIRGARLYIEEEKPGYFCLRLVVELIITPPDICNVTFNSDNIKARVDGFIEHPFPVEFDNLGISPSTNPRIADGAYSELTVTREMGVVCDGSTYLTMTPGELTFPDRLVYDLELIDIGRDWMAVVESDLHHVRDREYGGFPDLEKAPPEREEITIARWIPFAITATAFCALAGWIAWCILVRGWF